MPTVEKTEATEPEVKEVEEVLIEDKRPLTWQLRNKLTDAGFRKAHSPRKPQKRPRTRDKKSEGGRHLRNQPRRRRSVMNEAHAQTGNNQPGTSSGPKTQPTPGVSVSATGGIGRTALHTAVAVGITTVIVAPVTYGLIRYAKKPLPLEDAS